APDSTLSWVAESITRYRSSRSSSGTGAGAGAFADTPQASSSITRLKLPNELVTNTRIFVVVTGENTSWRHTRLLFVMATPGSFTHADPSQYCTWKFFNPKNVNVIVFVGSSGELMLSCAVKTSISSMVFNPLKSTSTQSGQTFCLPSHHPPPAPQFKPFRSPLLTAAAG